jgi:hypothetical protein
MVEMYIHPPYVLLAWCFINYEQGILYLFTSPSPPPPRGACQPLWYVACLKRRFRGTFVFQMVYPSQENIFSATWLNLN